MNKKKILYLMHIDWNWIKQRPQFLAEELSAYYEITVLYLPSYKRSFLTINPMPPRITIKPLRRLPGKLTRYSFFRKINELFLRLQCRHYLLSERFDFVWLTAPLFFKSVQPYTHESTIIYDCMDDAAGIKDLKLRSIFLQEEKILLKKARIIIASSAALQKSIKKKNTSASPFLVQNGAADSFIRQMTRQISLNNSKDKCFRFLYVGTISYWFDYEAVKRLAETYPQCSIDIIGPSEQYFPAAERVHFRGVSAHHDLPAIAQKYEALLLPFILSDFIRSVDPVKLYEYISFEKNIIARRYGELDKFEPYVWFYETMEDLIEKAGILLKQNVLKYDRQQAKDFLLNNSWGQRAATIKNILASESLEFSHAESI